MAVCTNISDARQGARKDDDDDVELRTKLQEMIQKMDEEEEDDDDLHPEQKTNLPTSGKNCNSP